MSDLAINDYDQFKDDLTKDQEFELTEFIHNFKVNIDRYSEVSDKIDFPVSLISAIHWRESSGDFNTYLHQGDPLGVECKHEPKYPEVPIFDAWEDAAEHAIKMKKSAMIMMRLSQSSQDLNDLCSFAEIYNGLGYHHKGISSPYVLSGTTGYIKGKYVADGKFDSEAIDQQLGVLPMLRAII
jgi:lysozyme family protein